MDIRKWQLLVVALCFSQLSISQSEWFPIGAEWYYSRQESSLNKDFFLVSVEWDTVLAGRDARIIKSPIYSNNDGFIFVSSDGQDSVFVFSEAREDWVLLYDFSARVGDTIYTFLTPWDTTLMEVIIDSISILEINGDTFDVQYVSTNPKVDWSNQNIRFLGNKQFLLPQNLLVIPQGPLRCYYPSVEQVYSLVEFACDLVPVNNPNSPDGGVKIYPNPAKDFLVIEGLEVDTYSYSVRIFNLYGRLLHDSELTTNRLSIKNLSNGLYFLSIYSSHINIFSQKFSKH